LKKENMNPPVRYVLLVVADPACGFAVGITKKKGPAHLLGRITFPGGKIEAGESLKAAASREMLEETGVVVPEADWQVVDSGLAPEYELYKLVAQSDKVLHARQREDEPVWHLAYARHLEYAKAQPAQYVEDFIPTLQAALTVIGVPFDAVPSKPGIPTCV
jgi:8-oxo-dGTP pyrophosphatase MutT (NUDIX family)